MASGLYIQKKKEFRAATWLTLCVIAGTITASGWLVFRWYTTGEVPSFIMLPASALGDTSIDESPISEQAKSTHKVGLRHPRYLSVPSIGINKTRIFSVGMTDKKVLELPTNIHDVGWYRESAFPGQGYGIVLLDGHSVGINSKGPFVKLSELKVGSKIMIERGDGKQLSYKVTENMQEDFNQANTSGIKRLLSSYDQDKEGLSIIAPSGKWIPRDETFSQRSLIRAIAI